MAGASSGWASSLDEADVGAELPCKLVDFWRGVSRVASCFPLSFDLLTVPSSTLPLAQTKIPENPQTLSSPDLFTYHPPDCTE